MNEWFQIQLQAENPAVAEIFINDYIGNWADQMYNDWLGTDSPITAKAIIDQLAALPESVRNIRVHINSPGGDVSAAVMIANAFRDQRVTKGRTVETIVDGLAASSASLIAMAGSPVRIADNGILMIHEPWTVALGNSAEMRKTADVLDQIRNASIIPTYQWHSKKSADEIASLMAAETWMDADEAIANGFADEKVEGLKAAASIDPRHATKLKVPEKFAARVKACMMPMADPNMPKVGDRVKIIVTPHGEGQDEGVVRQALDGALGIEFDSMPGMVHHWYVPSEVMVTESADDPISDKKKDPMKKGPMKMLSGAAKPSASGDHVLKACADAGLDLEFARAAISENLTVEALSQRIATETAARAAAEVRAADIRALCGKAHEDLVPDLIASGMTFDQVKSHICKVAAKLDKVEIDAGLAPEGGKARKPAINISAIYAELNKTH